MIPLAAKALSRFAQFAFQRPTLALVAVLMLAIIGIGIAVTGTVWLIAYPTLPKVFFFATVIAALLWGLTRS